MEEKHYIEWIEIIAGENSYRKFLKPGDKPKAEFEIKAEKIEAREYCNLHGLWKSQIYGTFRWRPYDHFATLPFRSYNRGKREIKSL